MYTSVIRDCCISFYAVKNSDGKFYRAVAKMSYHHHKIWVDTIKEAKIYPKIGGAKAAITRLSKSESNIFLIELVVSHIKRVSQIKT